MGQRGGHQEILAGQIDVQRLRLVHVLEVPVGDEADGDVEDVELVLLDEREQQIERPLEDGQRDGEGAILGRTHLH